MSQPVVLRPFQCAQCGAAVPLGRGSTARCPYCSASSPIPASYLQLQRTAAGFAQDRTLAQQLYGRVGRPPGWFLRNWGFGAQRSAHIGGLVVGGIVMVSTGQPLIGLALALAGVYALGYPIAALIRAVAWVFALPLSGPLSPLLVVSATMAMFVGLIGVPVVLFGREKELAEVRRDIHASLAASAPERPGGPSRCRSCGAALDVPAGALGVPCPYCAADNLVALPESWVRRIQSSEFHHFLRIDAALSAYREASRRAQERMWKLSLAVVFVFPVVLTLAYLLDKAGIQF